MFKRSGAMGQREHLTECRDPGREPPCRWAPPSLETSDQMPSRAGQQSDAGPVTLHGMNCPGERTVLIARCCSEAPQREYENSAKPSRPFCLKEKKIQLVPPPKIIGETMQVTGSHDNKRNTEKVAKPPREHHAPGSHFSVTDRLGATH